MRKQASQLGWAGFFVAVVFAAACANTPEGAKVDDQCIAGKLSAEGADYLNATDTAWHKGKRHGGFTAPVRPEDRVLARACSRGLIAIAEGDVEALNDALDEMRGNDDERPAPPPPTPEEAP